MPNIKSVFDGVSPFKITPAFIKQIHLYGQAFVNKTEDHVAFFGGNLTGVHVVRFTTSDKNEWVSDFLEYDEYEIK